MAPNLGEEENNRTYGNDPVEILNDWVTIAEDGYLTLRFATCWGNGQSHFVNLISTQNPDNSYEVEFATMLLAIQRVKWEMHWLLSNWMN